MKNRHALLYSSLILVALLYALHVLANEYSLYWQYWWFDVINHFLAGFAGGLAAYWILYHSGIGRATLPHSSANSIFVVTACVLVAGLGWEYLEYYLNLTDSHEGYILDVVNDLILDGSGGALAALIGLRKRS